MDDAEIIDLYWQRDEAAIAVTHDKYGRYCHAIALGILHSGQDSEECVNDTYLRAWEAMPPQRPHHLRAFLGRITRNLALNRWSADRAEKRGGGQVPLTLEELSDCLPDQHTPAGMVDTLALTELLDHFLGTLTPEARTFFLGRYWYFRTVREIAEDWGAGESKVKMSLLRSRRALAALLNKEGFAR